MDLPENFREEKLLSNFDGLELSLLISTPEKNSDVKAIVQFEHGMSDHKERFIPIMGYLSDLGYVCIGHDHRGHGKSVRSKDDLGFLYSGGFEAMIDDSYLVLSYIKRTYPDKKLIILGHSMGSFIARSLAKRYDSDIDGLILTGSPSYNPAIGLVRLLASLIKRLKGERHRSNLLNGFVFGIYSMKVKDDSSKFSWICTDKDVVRQYEEDDLCGFVFTTNGFENLFRLMMDVYNTENWKLSNPTMPIRFLSGENDPCHDGKRKFFKSVGFMGRVGYTDVKRKLYPGMRHEILNEVNKKIVWSDISDALEPF